MKKPLFLLFLLAGLSWGAKAQTDTSTTTLPDTTRPMQFAFGIDVGTSLKPSNAIYSSVAGISLKLEIPCQSKKAFIILQTGYSHYAVNSKLNINTSDTIQTGHFIPIFVGFKYFVYNRLYLEGDVGNMYNINQDFLGYQSAFTYSPSIGYSFKLKNPYTFVEFSAYYESRLSKAGNINQAAIRIAYNWGLL